MIVGREYNINVYSDFICIFVSAFDGFGRCFHAYTHTHTLFLSSASYRTNVGHVTSHHGGPCLVQRPVSVDFFFHNSHSKSIKLHKFLFSANGGSEAAKEKKHYCSTLTFKIISTLFNDLTLGKESKKRNGSARDRFSSPEGKFAITRAFSRRWLDNLFAGTNCI